MADPDVDPQAGTPVFLALPSACCEEQLAPLEDERNV